MDELTRQDPQIAKAVQLETNRQITKLELIASENFVSHAVRLAQGSVMTHKYAEGYPGKRYYGGCEYVDMAENLAIERARQLFGAEYANVQPHSGSQANMGAYFAAIEPGDTVLGMNLERISMRSESTQRTSPASAATTQDPESLAMRCSIPTPKIGRAHV